jgi:hypothetical protein
LDEVAQSAPEISEEKDMAGSKLPEAEFATVPFNLDVIPEYKALEFVINWHSKLTNASIRSAWKCT